MKNKFNVKTICIDDFKIGLCKGCRTCHSTARCNTHEPHAKLSGGKKGYTIALRTGPSMPECERVISSIEHFHGHLEIESCGKLGLCSIEYKEDVARRIDQITDFCNMILEG